MLTNKIKVLDFSRELPMACLSRNENIELSSIQGKIFNSMLVEFSHAGKELKT